MEGLWQNLGPELAGAVVTYVLLDLVLGTRQRKADLIARMGSRVTDVAVAGVEDLRRDGWLTDGSLRGGDLRRANLVKADLRRANLAEADLACSHLGGAYLVGANLAGASLAMVSLEKAYLVDANLRGSNLVNADVAIDQLSEAKSLAGATLPDGVKLSEDDWQAEFEEWRRKQEEQKSDD